jgi:hypothetical protein
MAELPHQSYVSVTDCAAAGCDRSIRGDDAVSLQRISPKGGPFVGLCQDHYGRSVVLKPEASAVLDD